MFIAEPKFSRRTALGLLAAATVNQPSFATGVADKPFIFILLRGGMDGLSALIPQDKETVDLRQKLIPEHSELLDLKNGFSLHPSFKSVNNFYKAGDASFIHACSTSYRSRSHFDAQDFLEVLGSGQVHDGWLNRALKALGGNGLALARSIPLALQGETRVANWSPPLFDEVSPDLLDRLSNLYVNDTELTRSLESAQDSKVEGMSINRRSSRKFTLEYPIALEALGRIMSAKDGPGVGMVALNGWDTHLNQLGQLGRKFQQLDAGLLALRQQLGDKWDKTCIVVCSEFGRTAAINGTRGTDHGTGGLMMLLGGAVAGGRIKGEWPGLKKKALYEGRDLAPANDVTAVLKGVLRDHLGFDRATLDRSIFPNSSRAFDGLIQS